MIQDIFPDVFHNEYRPQAKPMDSSPVLCFRERKILVKVTDEGDVPLQFPTAGLISRQKDAGTLVYAFAVNETEYFLRIWENQHCTDAPEESSADEASQPEVTEGSGTGEASQLESPKIAGSDEASQPEVPDGFEYLDFFQARRNLSNVFGMIIFTGYHLHMWYSGRRFCGYCGKAVVHDSLERAVCCPACGQKNFPRIMPAVIVGVIHGDRLLQTKYSSGFQYYALIAGFTEVGETLEETVQREVMEETGLRVKNIRYYKSQPWGLAGDVLAGFYCDLDGDDTITMDKNELAVAVWRHRSEIELQPDNYSLTNEMMRRFKEGKDC